MAARALLYIIALRKNPYVGRLGPARLSPTVVAALIGYYGFAEPMGVPKVAGIAMICLGVS